MKSFKATDFKAGCLALLDQVARSGETITITKHGKLCRFSVTSCPGRRS